MRAGGGSVIKVAMESSKRQREQQAQVQQVLDFIPA
jgi:hypothetical protein